jgi:hypothetical protein
LLLSESAAEAVKFWNPRYVCMPCAKIFLLNRSHSDVLSDDFHIIYYPAYLTPASNSWGLSSDPWRGERVPWLRPLQIHSQHSRKQQNITLSLPAVTYFPLHVSHINLSFSQEPTLLKFVFDFVHRLDIIKLRFGSWVYFHHRVKDRKAYRLDSLVDLVSILDPGYKFTAFQKLVVLSPNMRLAEPWMQHHQ